MISIIVCSYNYAEYLGECIDSLLDQTFTQPYEIIVVDDGSTDDSRNVIEGYNSEKIRAFYQENAGQFSAFSKGVKESRYDIICFCDCDDTFVPEKLEIIYKYFQDYPDVGMVLHKGLVFGVKELEGRVHPGNKRIETAKLYPKMNVVEDYVSPVSISSGLNFRKETIESVADFESIFWLHKHYGDILYRAVSIIVSESLFIPEVLCNYRVHDKSHHLTNFNAKTNDDPVMNRLVKEHIYVYVNEYLASRGLKQLSLLDNVSWRNFAKAGGGLRATELSDELAQTRSQLSLKENELSLKHGELQGMRESWSWKITAPLRSLIDMVSSKSGASPCATTSGRVSRVEGRKAEKIIISAEREKIEILSVELFDTLKDEMAIIDKFQKYFKIGIGWHYYLDLAWLIKEVSVLPKGSLILDAGAGGGMAQFVLAELGYNVISADFANRKFSKGYVNRYENNMYYLNDQSEVFDTEYTRHLQKNYNLNLKKESGDSDRREDEDPKTFIEEKMYTGEGRGVDSVESILKSGAEEHLGSIFVYKCDLKNISLLPDGFVDGVVSVSALEHNDHDGFRACMKDIVRVLRPGGLMAVTVSASQKEDWLHKPSKGWCYSEASLKELFTLDDDVKSNFSQKEKLFEILTAQDNELHKRLAPLYFKSGDNGMPWGKWNPQYQPVGVVKVKAQ